MSFPEPFYRWRPHAGHGLEPGPDPPRSAFGIGAVLHDDRAQFGESPG